MTRNQPPAKFRCFKTDSLTRSRKFANRWRDFPTNTCPASRHLHLLADELAKGKIPFMITEEPKHVADSIYATIGSLWKARSRLKRAGK